MIEQRYKHVVLPIFYIMDILGLTFIYFYLTVHFGYELINTNYLILIFNWAITSYYFKSYDIPRTPSKIDAIRPMFYAYSVFVLLYVLLNTGFVLYRLVLLNILTDNSIIFHTIFLITLFVLLITFSYTRFYFIHNYRLRGKNTRYAILFSPEINHTRLSRLEADALHYGYRFEKKYSNSDTLLQDIQDVVFRQRIDMVFLMESDQVITDDVSALCDEHGLRLKILLPLSAATGRRAGLDQLGGFPVMDVRHEPLLYLGNRIMKRTVDFLMAFLSIVFILTWLPVVVKLAQVFSYPGPLFFVQERIGRDGKIFNLYKFRTMIYSKEVKSAKKGQAEKTHEMDKRVPWFGRLLRRTNLDEYPQFLNVLFSSMSTVGPRPHMVGEDKVLVKKVSRYRVRRFVKPGITGWAAINGYRGGTDDIELMSKRTEHDIWYLENWTIWLDIKIMAITIWQMITLRIPRAY